MRSKEQTHYLGQEKIPKLMLKFSIPCILSLLVSALYNIVDQVFIGNSEMSALGNAATGVVFPIFIIAQAFAWCFGDGCAAYLNICQGKKDTKNATACIGSGITITLLVSLILMAVFFPLKEQILTLFGASENTIGMAVEYFNIILAFFPANMLMNMMNSVIRADGSPAWSMASMLSGAIINIILDPVFIFVVQMDVAGAALATILSQAVSAAWVLRFLFSAKSGIRIRRGNMKFEKRVVGKVIGLGIAPFIMQSTESLVNITLNAGLQRYGGDLYVGSMTIMQSVMQMLVMPIQGITQGAQPIMSYNYGAKNYSRVRKTFSLLLKVMLLVTVSGFALAALLPGVLARMFTQDAELIEIVKKMMPIFFGGIWAFGAQMACQTTFMALGQAKISLFLALLRKVVLLVPLALLLPVVMGGNVLGIYIAEPVADVIASFTTLSLFLIKRKTLLPDGGAPAKSK